MPRPRKEGTAGIKHWQKVELPAKKLGGCGFPRMIVTARAVNINGSGAEEMRKAELFGSELDMYVNEDKELMFTIGKQVKFHPSKGGLRSGAKGLLDFIRKSGIDTYELHADGHTVIATPVK